MNAVQPDGLLRALLGLWATLRASHHVYWTLHWQSKGVGYYGDHLLYQRLYEARVKEIDRMAETIAALYGVDKLDAGASWSAAGTVIDATMNTPDPGTRAAEFVLRNAEATNRAIGGHPYGVAVNNVIAGIADSALESIYLLQQRGAR
jgi:DNA-binding ferritin-like protein